jgi:eukaryotic-like serine/threonine-protein kinase
MSTKIGHFEILSELAKSPTSTVYKANDLESGQTIALKAIQLSAFGENAAALEQTLLAEAESAKVLSSSNIVTVYGAGVIDGQFCAAMEYVQGNSIATMLARKEGFTIWDLLDIGRQLCSALDHAKSHNIVHYSVEPAKIMCGWDGGVKLLSFGVSSVGKFAHLVPEGIVPSLFYMSPEQVQGQEVDARSNLFSLGAIFYEMVTERKAFDREDVASLQQSIVESTPVAPIHVNPKVHPLLSDLILKALQKDPAQRYQSGRELLDDLEKCKETKKVAAPAKKAEPANGTAISSPAKTAAQSKFVSSAASANAVPGSRAASPSASAASRAAESKIARPVEKKPAATASPAPAKAAPAPSKAAAAAAGASSSLTFSTSRPETSEPELDISDNFTASSVSATIEEAERPSASMSAAAIDEPQIETFEPQNDNHPKIAIDPMMAEGGPMGGSGTSFSEISELPPLKDVYVAPPPPPPAEPEPQQVVAAPMVRASAKPPEKPKVQARQVAQKAIKEVKNVPPKLMMYALGGAGVLILLIGIGVMIYVHTLSSDDDNGSQQTTSVTQAPAKPAASPAQAQPTPAPAPVQSTDADSAQQQQAAEPDAVPVESAKKGKGRSARRKSAPAAPAIILGEIQLDSTPEGAQVTVDGKSDPSYVTPFALTNLPPGQHSITVSKPGYVSDSRTVTVTGGNRATFSVRLAQLTATLVVNSTPAGANVYIDGHDTGTKTPAQVSVGKGQHVVLVRKMGYIDETMNQQFVLGQTFNFSPSLRALGNVDSIRTIGKMSRLFGGKAQAGQTTVNIRTQPKGAQVAINQHVIEKNTPLEVALDPGNYVIDITLTGYAPIHKVISADQGGKIVLDESLQPQ